MRTFDSDIEILGLFPCDFPKEVIKDEPMFFNSDLNFAWKNGGPITRAFLQNVPTPDWADDPVFDSRVHMLMPNWYPCIPGWHHDDVPRSTSTGQPNYDTPEYKSWHLTGLVNAEICPTEFLLGKIEVPEPDISRVIYEDWDKAITEKYCLKDTISNKSIVYKAESGRYIEFNCDTFHQGTKAVKDGWRWFGRLSKNTDRQKTMTNEIRRQAQVYLEHPKAGW